MILSYMNKKDFFKVCRSGSPDEVRKALQSNIDLDDVDEFDRTALMVAVMFNEDISVAGLLLETGVPVNELDGSDMSALHYAVDYSRSVEFVRLLLEAGADVNCISADNRSILMSAAAFNHEAVPLLLEAGADVNVVDECGLDAVMYNIYFNYCKSVVKCLFESGASGDHVDSLGRDWKEYIRLFMREKRDLRPQRVDVVQSYVLSDEEKEARVACGVTADDKEFWVERLVFVGDYVINYQGDSVWESLLVQGISPDVDYCVPGAAPGTWVLASRGESGFYRDNGYPNVFIIGSDGKVLCSFFGGDGIVSIVPLQDRIWFLYDEVLSYEGKEGYLLERDFDGKVIGVFRYGSEEDRCVCVSVCKDGDVLYAMFEPGMHLVRLDGVVKEIECHQAFSEMVISGKLASMRVLNHVDNLMYLYEIGEDGLVLLGRLALWENGKPVIKYR